MAETLAARHYRVRGRVQSVGFRYFVQQTAHRLGIVGWVRNRLDGTVEVAAVGVVDVLEDLRAALSSGPPGARVDEVEEQALQAIVDWQQFEIRATA